MILTIHAKPGAKTTRLVAQLDERTFTIALHAIAAEGEANEALIAFLSQTLNIPKTHIVLRRGHASKIKHIEIPDGTALDGLKN